MELGFWEKLPKPILALAPMANVTDVAFRRIIAKYGKPARPGERGGPDVMFTEFVSADGLMNKKGREALLVDLLYSESERPIVAQLFSGNPEKMFEAAKLAKELGFDGLDINMGCPDRSIEKSGAGAALIKNPRLAREIIRAAKEGVATAFYSPLSKGALPIPPARGGVSSPRDEVVGVAGGMLTTPASDLPAEASAQTGDVGTPFIKGDKSSASEDLGTSFRKGGIKSDVPIPVSIKTRLGYNKDILEEWLPELLAEKPVAITIHARTRKEMSKVPAHWERVKRAVEIRDAFFSSPPFQGGDKRGGSRTLILGNGDVKDIADAQTKAKETGVDGIMLGRAIFGNPWLFAGGGERLNLSPDLRFNLTEPPVKEKLQALVEHTKLFEKLLGKHKSFAIMKKHFKAYVEGFDGAKELRMKLMETETAEEVETIIHHYLRK